MAHACAGPVAGKLHSQGAYLPNGWVGLQHAAYHVWVLQQPLHHGRLHDLLHMTRVNAKHALRMHHTWRYEQALQGLVQAGQRCVVSGRPNCCAAAGAGSGQAWRVT
jgi:hypothetical protein